MGQLSRWKQYKFSPFSLHGEPLKIIKSITLPGSQIPILDVLDLVRCRGMGEVVVYPQTEEPQTANPLNKLTLGKQ